MKLRIATLAFPLILTCSLCLAEPPSTTNQSSVPLSNILETLQENGYVSIKEVSLDNNTYKINAFDLAGQEFTFEVNADTGEFLNKPKSVNGITTQQAAVAVEKAGYGRIKSITADDKFYSVDVLDKKSGEDIDLEVSRSNGVVSED
jgi:hypothetical protein